MGLNFGSSSKIILGVGLGILAVSCLVVTVCFGGSANNTTDLVKIKSQLKFDNNYSLYSCSVAIAVFGCISAAAAIGAIVLSILMEEQTVILIIVGGVSAFFALGCIITEGIYTLQTIKANVDSILEYSYGGPFDYNEKIFNDYSHKDAQKYIKNAIKELYEQGKINLESRYNDLEDLPSWKTVYERLGDKANDGHIYTYGDIWTVSTKSKNITLKTNNINGDYMIMACYGYDKCIEVASLSFYHTGTIQEKRKVCWYNKDKTDIECAKMNGDKKKNCEKSYSPDSNYFLDEKIVVGEYIKESEVANYRVKSFPFAYYLLSYEELIKIKEQEEDEDECKHSPFSFENNNKKEFKVSGKRFAKAKFNDYKQYNDKSIDRNIYLAPQKVKNIDEYNKKCDIYKNEQESKDEKDEDYRIKCQKIDINYAYGFLQNKYQEKNKGKVIPAVRKYYMKYMRKNSKNSYLDNLYTMALINMIIQIFGIIFWACGRFLPVILGKSDAKTPSDGEA